MMDPRMEPMRGNGTILRDYFPTQTIVKADVIRYLSAFISLESPHTTYGVRFVF